MPVKLESILLRHVRYSKSLTMAHNVRLHVLNVRQVCLQRVGLIGLLIEAHVSVKQKRARCAHHSSKILALVTHPFGGLM